MLRQARLLALISLPLACGVTPERGGAELGSGAVTRDFESEATCPDWMCNAATVGDGLVFDEIAYGSPTLMNFANLFISRAEMNGRPVRFGVRGNEVTLGNPQGPAGGVATAEVDGLVLVATHLNGAEYELRFERTMRTKFWVGAGEVPYHQIRVRKIRQGVENGLVVGRTPDASSTASLCAGTPDPKEGQEVTEMAVLFEGDRYDSRTKTVKEVPPGGPWFNIACAGTAMLKMHLLRYTRAAAIVPVDVLQRQAMLKALTADYCGTGIPYTVNGHPLLYTDALGLVPAIPLDVEALLRQGATVEAHWGPTGATCLDVPRYVARQEVACTPRKILRHCGTLGDWKVGGGVLSLNPPPKGP
jgi:ADYC domain